MENTVNTNAQVEEIEQKEPEVQEPVVNEPKVMNFLGRKITVEKAEKKVKEPKAPKEPKEKKSGKEIAKKIGKIAVIGGLSAKVAWDVLSPFINRSADSGDLNQDLLTDGESDQPVIEGEFREVETTAEEKTGTENA